MFSPLHRLPDSRLNEIADALQSERITFPCTELAIYRIVRDHRQAESLVSYFNYLNEQNFTAAQVAVLLNTLKQDRYKRAVPEDFFDLVTTSPDVKQTMFRNTGAVMRELFSKAQKTVLVSGYAVYGGKRVFQTLADRMLEQPRLQVRLFLNIQRKKGNQDASQEIIRRFRNNFYEREWPNERPLPELFYFPTSLSRDEECRPCLHAKCAVVDGESVFISSANLTESAQNRNIEVGLLVRSGALAHAVASYFDTLLRKHVFESVAVDQKK